MRRRRMFVHGADPGRQSPEKAKNFIITPHIIWAPRAIRQRFMDCAVENLKAFIAGSPVNVVNK